LFAIERDRRLIGATRFARKGDEVPGEGEFVDERIVVDEAD
jgi:hypothetical protein